jgi:hypothetical protein
MAFADEYQIPTRLMTSDEVFAALVQFTRDGMGESSLDSCTRASSAKILVAEFGYGWFWADAADNLNAIFQIDLPRTAWREVLVPARTKTLGGVCDLIARHASVPSIEPVIVLGDHSLSAGAFLVIRRILADRGVDVSELRPSSALRLYLPKYLDVLFAELVRAAPCRVPCPAIDAPVHDAIGLAGFVSGAVVAASQCLGLGAALTAWATAASILLFLAKLICCETIKPREIRLGDARTFADLARVLAGERCERQGFPVVTR